MFSMCCVCYVDLSKEICKNFIIIYTEMLRLMELRDRNDNISGHLNRNRSRDFTLKQEQVEVRMVHIILRCETPQLSDIVIIQNTFIICLLN